MDEQQRHRVGVLQVVVTLAWIVVVSLSVGGYFDGRVDGNGRVLVRELVPSVYPTPIGDQRSTSLMGNGSLVRVVLFPVHYADEKRV
jgi:hypothetical protein